LPEATLSGSPSAIRGVQFVEQVKGHMGLHGTGVGPVDLLTTSMVEMQFQAFWRRTWLRMGLPAHRPAEERIYHFQDALYFTAESAWPGVSTILNWTPL